MIVGGALGGCASYLTTSVPSNEAHPMLRRVVVGVSASAIVPLFLNMISSAIISDDMDLQDYLIFMGFCVVAGYSSKSFLSSVSKQLLDKVEKLGEKQSELEEEFEPIKAKETEPEGPPTNEIEEDEALLYQGRDEREDELSILFAITNSDYSWRTVGGIKGEVKMKQSHVKEVLKNLESKNLVKQYVRDDGKQLWAATGHGFEYERKLSLPK